MQANPNPNIVYLREPADERRMPPQDIYAERAIIGGILLDPIALERVADMLPVEAFYIKAHGIIYRAALALRKQEKPYDFMTVASFLADYNQLEAVGGRLAIAELVDETISSANIDQYAELVVDKWRRRQMGELGRKLIELQFDPEPTSEVLNVAERDLTQLMAGNAPRLMETASDILVDTFSEIEQRSLGGVLPGVPCGFYDLDGMMSGGFQRSDLIIAAGRPSMGKTSLVLNIARNVAAQKLPVAIFSLEMSKRQLINRLLSAECEIESSRLTTGRIAQHEWEGLGRAVSAISDLPLQIDDNPVPTVAEMRSHCRRILAHSGALGLVLIDYLQLMGGDGPNRVQELSTITRQLKQMARELNCPIIALSQLSRGVESRTNKRPLMSDLRESGAIEQDSDLIMMLYREEYYEPDTPDRGIAEVNITKHRNGPTGTVKLLFEPQFTRFRNLKGVA
jgi:replicative DNA helicase